MIKPICSVCGSMLKLEICGVYEVDDLNIEIECKQCDEVVYYFEESK